MTSRRFRVPLGSDWLRRRLLWTAILVLISLGGAGLASAIDRPQTQAQRPELGWTADQRAEPWLAALLVRLEPVEEGVSGLSASARRVLVELSGLSVDDLEGSIATGDQAILELTVAVAELEALRRNEPEAAEPWRLGEANRDLLARIDAAVQACQSLPPNWQEMREAARSGGRLVSAIEAHDAFVLDALAAGRDARWADAVGLLVQALPLLDEADAAARDLSPAEAGAAVELLERHRAHDEALLALYELLDETDSLQDPRLEPLRRDVEASRLPLPTPAAILQSLLSETVLPILTERLVGMEDARGRVADALRPNEQEAQ